MMSKDVNILFKKCETMSDLKGHLLIKMSIAKSLTGYRDALKSGTNNSAGTCSVALSIRSWSLTMTFEHR